MGLILNKPIGLQRARRRHLQLGDQARLRNPNSAVHFRRPVETFAVPVTFQARGRPRKSLEVVALSEHERNDSGTRLKQPFPPPEGSLLPSTRQRPFVNSIRPAQRYTTHTYTLHMHVSSYNKWFQDNFWSTEFLTKERSFE